MEEKNKKTGKEIPVQPRKRSLRKYKQSGKGRATPGRRHGNLNRSLTGLIKLVGEQTSANGDFIGHSMEPPKRKRRKQAHDLEKKVKMSFTST